MQLRPIYHQLERRIEAHIFVAFMAYCLHVTLRARVEPRPTGLTPRAVLDKLAVIQMLDVHFPTTDGRTLILSRYTNRTPSRRSFCNSFNLTLPAQPPPKITINGQPPAAAQEAKCSGDLLTSSTRNSSPFQPPLPSVEKVGLAARCKEREQNTRESAIPSSVEPFRLPTPLLCRTAHTLFLLRRCGCVNRTSHPSGSSESTAASFALAAWPPQKHLGTVLRPIDWADLWLPVRGSKPVWLAMRAIQLLQIPWRWHTARPPN